MDKLDFIKIKNFYYEEDHVKRMKNEAIRRNYLQTMYSMKD